MTLKIVLVALVAALALSAAPIVFNASSVTATGGVTTAAQQTFTSTTSATCSSGCSFVYNDSVGGGLNGHALFQITNNPSANDPGLVGLFGNIGILNSITGAVASGQTFGVGTIVDTIPGVREDALVTVPAGIEFIINDGLGTAASNYFTALITAFDFTSIQVGSFNFNLGGIVNLSSFSYTGANAALLALAANPAGILTENFTLGNTTSDLAALFNPIGSPRSNPFTLSVSTVPEPRFYGLVLCGLLGLAGIAIRRRKTANA